MISGHSFTEVETAGVHWLADAVHPLGTWHAVFGEDRLKPMMMLMSTFIAHDSINLNAQCAEF